MIERDESGKLKVRRRPTRRDRATTETATPTVEGPTVVQRFDRLGRRINRNEKARCTARTVSGEPCQAYAIAGATVCRVHGGSAPQVKAAAKTRLENAADRMAKQLLGMAEDENIPASVKLAAIKDALDRAGLSPTHAVTIGGGEKPIDIALGLVTVRRGRREVDPADEPRVIEGEVIEPAPEWHDKLAAHVEAEKPRPSLPPTRPREEYVNSDDTPPAHVRAKTPGYTTRRGSSQMTR